MDVRSTILTRVSTRSQMEQRKELIQPLGPTLRSPCNQGGPAALRFRLFAAAQARRTSSRSTRSRSLQRWQAIGQDTSPEERLRSASRLRSRRMSLRARHESGLWRSGPAVRRVPCTRAGKLRGPVASRCLVKEASRRRCRLLEFYQALLSAVPLPHPSTTTPKQAGNCVSPDI